MNYNKTVNFEKVAAPKMRRSIIDIPFKNDLTAELGKIVPVFTKDVVPGTNLDIKSMAQVRLITPFKVPNFDNLEASFYWFFTPYRICWGYWEKFIAGGDTSNITSTGICSGAPTDWTKDVEGSGLIPKLQPTCDLVVPGSLWDYMGVPVFGASQRVNTNYVTINNALPFMAYNLIFNEYFRDQNLMSMAGFDFGAAQGATLSVNPYLLRDSCKKRDVFTTALIKPQRGNAIQLPILSEAPVIVGDSIHNPFVKSSDPMKFSMDRTGGSTASFVGYVLNEAGGGAALDSQTLVGTKQGTIAPNNLVADLSQAQGIDVAQLRILVQCQRWLERLAYGGGRYGEVIFANFGTDPGDKRLQRPEFLGMSTIDVNTQEVIKTASSADDLGQTGARSNSVGKTGYVNKAFTEFGVVNCFMVIRQKYNTYQQGLRPLLDYKDRLSLFWPVFSHISYQPIKNKYIFMQPDNSSAAQNDATFGFNEPYVFLKTMPNEVHGDMLSNSGTGSLDYWHYGDYYSALPTLTSTWLKSTDVNLKRALLIPTGQTTPVRPFAVNFRAKVRMTSLIPINSDPGYMDHF